MNFIDNNPSIPVTNERSVAIDLTPVNNINTIHFSSSCTPIISTPIHLKIIEERRERNENNIHFRS